MSQIDEHMWQAGWSMRAAMLNLALEREEGPSQRGWVRMLGGALVSGNSEARECLMKLLEAGWDPNAKDAQLGGWTAGHWAAQRGQEEFLMILLEAGWDPDAKTEDGVKAIDLAQGGCEELLEEAMRAKEERLRLEEKVEDAENRGRPRRPGL